MHETEAVISANAGHLTQLDSAIGDGDHAVNLASGFRAVRTALEAGASVTEALEAAADAAAEGARATVPMQARKGRASYLGPRSIGHEDPGAASTALVVAALGRAVTA